MERTPNYRLGFDAWGLAAFLLIMLPNLIWFAIPAPHDILRTQSTTPVTDLVASVFQVLTIACLCLIVNNKRHPLRLSPLVVASAACIASYYLGWILYYADITHACVILLLTIAPCVALILFAADRKNLPALLFASVFAICHLIFGIANFIV